MRRDFMKLVFRRPLRSGSHIFNGRQRTVPCLLKKPGALPHPKGMAKYPAHFNNFDSREIRLSPIFAEIRLPQTLGRLIFALVTHRCNNQYDDGYHVRKHLVELLDGKIHS